MKKKYAEMEPLEEIHAIRDELVREFRTIGAICDHLDERQALKPSAKPPRGGRRDAAETEKQSAPRRRGIPAHA